MRWEYKFVEFDAVNNISHVYRINEVPFKDRGPHTLRTNFCNQLGLEGWEMVYFSPQFPWDKGPSKTIAVFKKLLSDVKDLQPLSWPQTMQ